MPDEVVMAENQSHGRQGLSPFSDRPDSHEWCLLPPLLPVRVLVLTRPLKNVTWLTGRVLGTQGSVR